MRLKWIRSAVQKIRLKKIIRRLLQIFIVVVITIFGVRAFDSLRLPDLKPWHRAWLTEEFQRRGYTPSMTFEDYKKIEDKLFQQLHEKVDEKVLPEDRDPLSRYTPNSPANPDQYPQNWNRSFERMPGEPKGGILLIHGLTDSPYSMKSLAEFFYEKDFYVLAMRMPGHGTAPAGLTHVQWEDWMAAVKIGAAHVRGMLKPDQPFYIAGYSTGGPLALLYTLRAQQQPNGAVPDRLILLSPAIGISRFAGLAEYLLILSYLPGFEKSEWTSILPEYDPFKYTSFPLNAGRQIYRLSGQTQKEMIKHHADSGRPKLPPVLTFQSIVDSTVNAQDVIDRLYAYLPEKDHHLVLFNVNQHAYLKDFLKTPHAEIVSDLTRPGIRNYRVTVVTNVSADTDQVMAATRAAGSETVERIDLNLRWPTGVYSMSHLAIPAPLDDPLYGLTPAETEGYPFHLGNVELRGERNLLKVSEADLMRLRSNPFFDFVKSTISDWIAPDLQ